MNLKDKVADFELCKKDKELGFPQGNSEFVWVRTQFDWDLRRNNIDEDVREERPNEFIDALLTDEILEQLPKELRDMSTGVIKFIPKLTIEFINLEWFVSYQINNSSSNWFKSDKKLSSALLKMWIYLKENKLI